MLKEGFCLPPLKDLSNGGQRTVLVGKSKVGHVFTWFCSWSSLYIVATSPTGLQMCLQLSQPAGFLHSKTCDAKNQA